MPGDEPAQTYIPTAGGTAADELSGFEPSGGTADLTPATSHGTASVTVLTTPARPAAARQPEPPPIGQTFAELGVTEGICAALADAGIVTAFPIQSLALPIALSGQDIIGQARTGTGKTLCFG